MGSLCCANPVWMTQGGIPIAHRAHHSTMLALFAAFTMLYIAPPSCVQLEPFETPLIVRDCVRRRMLRQASRIGSPS